MRETDQNYRQCFRRAFDFDQLMTHSVCRPNTQETAHYGAGGTGEL